MNIKTAIAALALTVSTAAIAEPFYKKPKKDAEIFQSVLTEQGYYIKHHPTATEHFVISPVKKRNLGFFVSVTIKNIREKGAETLLAIAEYTGTRYVRGSCRNIGGTKIILLCEIPISGGDDENL